MIETMSEPVESGSLSQDIFYSVFPPPTPPKFTRMKITPSLLAVNVVFENDPTFSLIDNCTLKISTSYREIKNNQFSESYF